MKNLYNNVLAKLKADVPELKWIDLDKGQMNYDRPPVLFPAGLIDIMIPQAQNLNRLKQQCNARISIKVCFDYTGHTSGITPDEDRDNSLNYFNTVEKVYQKLQGYATADMNALARSNQYNEQRPDAYKVTVITFETMYHDFDATA